MDEPTAGMAPAERAALMALTRRIATGLRIAILFTEHDMNVVFAAADHILVLNRGALIAECDGPAIRAAPKVQEVHLGAHATREALMLAPLLAVQGLNSFYGRGHILRDLCFTVAPGELLVLPGRNGAGKSTTMRSLIGLVAPRQRQHPVRRPADRRPRALPHRPPRPRLRAGGAPIFANLTVAENLDVGRQLPWHRTLDGRPGCSPFSPTSARSATASPPA